ncbi:MAG TPA: cation:proton antiporter, partial [Planctomycetota bacterium]|nr:cation:proton antiporter [Planctomycetota bacterium]
MPQGLELATVVLLGVVAQWAAARVRLPSILLLLLVGFLAGPVLGLLDPDRLVGPLLFPAVSLAVAAILFEGGLSLRLAELEQIGSALTRLVTVGILVTWALAAWLAHATLGLSVELSVLLGALLTVTGPTVTLPLLAHVRPRGKVGPLAKWEGIVDDPIGAVLAVLVLQWIVQGGTAEAVGTSALGLLKAAGVGALLGA